MVKKKTPVKTASMKKSKIVVMPITRNRKEHIKELSSVLSNLLPTSSYYSSSVTLQTLAKEFKLDKSFKKQANKSEDYQHFLEALFRYHKRKPVTVVLEIVQQGMIKLSDRGELFREDDRDKIIVHMRALGFDIEKKLKQMVQPKLANVSVPTRDFTKIFDQLQLHVSLQNKVKQLYLQGHTNDAVRRATEIYEHKIQTIAGDTKISGEKLMSFALNENNTIIKMNALETNNETNEQRGMMYLSMGMMAGIRNIYSHGNSSTQGYIDALHSICFISFMLKKVDNRFG